VSKDAWFGTTLDGIWRSKSLRQPGFAVYIWNPNRTSVSDVVLDQAESPRYDITKWVLNISLKDTVAFEQENDAVVSSATIILHYDKDAIPIQITEKTLLHGTPIRIYQGDERVDKSEWVCVFTGQLHGNPAVAEEVRPEASQRQITVNAADRAAAFNNNVITAFSYDKGEDIGRAAVETAVEFMDLDRREIRIGYQDYAIGHEQSQLVDIEVLNGIYEILFCVGKKPRFDSLGRLVAADSDLDKPAARIHKVKDLVMSIVRVQTSQPVFNSVRLLGLSNSLSIVEEREKRLAHGTITSGFFEAAVREDVNFSENAGADEGGRRARDTRLARDKVNSLLGVGMDQSASWSPVTQDDGISVLGGQITFNTGFVPELRVALMATWYYLRTVELLSVFIELATQPGFVQAIFIGIYLAEAAAMLAMLQAFSTLGRLYWEVYGVPFQYVYQQLCSVAQLANLRTDQINETQIRNDWLYDIDVMDVRSSVLLKRELVKGWSYEITMLDDPILDVDDVIEIGDKKYYITSIAKVISRGTPDMGVMKVSAWRVS
jgi:hypothetical protein